MYQQTFIFAVPAFALLMAVEWFTDRRDPDRPANGISGRDTASNIATFVLGRISKPILAQAGLFFAVVLAAHVSPVHLSPRHWWVWALGLVVTDFCYYWMHRADHRVRVLWTAHSVHHSSRFFNFSTALRLSWLNPVATVGQTLFYIPAALLGFPAWMIFLLQSIGLLYQFPLHTQRIGKLWAPIEFVFNTPAHHRVHHGSNNPYLDKNYGGILMIWDRVFGSFAPEIEPIRYGLTKDIGTDNPIKVNYRELANLVGDVRHAETWRGRVGYVFGPPGWTEQPAPASAEPIAI
ncbi:sterol desaturase family protein [Nocardia stercoris]|uniref:Sterol desaturase family protein n=1 Tax=Nocardia stercoris TaxID=2483361 RepID=A0A3M2LD82_9NOCA|nr:sterol desaturase family protein [Nocardia stercoris]RMI35497.1 sterol desaturase family protein [Nocardia stercoris]